jgi:hypothetical protein
MVDVDASFSTSLVPVVAVTSGTGRIVAAGFSTDLVALVDLQNVRSRTASANFISSLDANVSLDDASVTTRQLSASLITSLNASVSLSGASDRRGRTVCELVKESLSLWGFLCSKTAPRYALDRAITDLNTAMQMVWNNAEGHDYWSNEALTIPLNDGEDEYTLPDSVQNVVGPCRRADNNRPLTPLNSIGELETFVDLYLNGETASEPLAYHVDRYKQSADDPAKCVFRVVPAVSGATVSFTLEVVKECPRYTVDDLNTCPLVPIPHQYAETLLIPIIRYHASSYYLFAAADQTQKETIDREYVQARIALGLADPNPVKMREGGEV